MRTAVIGAGLVGRRTARALVDSRQGDIDSGDNDLGDIILVSQSREPEQCGGATIVQGWPHPAAAELDIAVIATESSRQHAIARRLINAGVHVVTTADRPADIKRLWNLDAAAQDAGVSLVVGAAASPGLSTLLAAHLVRSMDSVDTISTAQFGTGGPACAREHHRTMGDEAIEVYQSAIRTSRGGSGRELVWFPDPVGPADCYRAGLADPFLLHQAFPAVRRIESRQAATRRDRLTAGLPMLRRPHAEGLLGAVWAEVRGRVDGRVEHRAMATTAAPATGAAAMAAACCLELARPEGERGIRLGAQSTATIENTVSLMQLVSNGVRLWTYDGSQIVPTFGVIGPIQAARKWRSVG